MTEENPFLPLKPTGIDEDTDALDQNEELSFAVPARRINLQVVLFVSIVSIGGGMLWAMRYVGTRNGMDFTVAVTEYNLETAGGVRFKNEARIMHDLDMSDQIVQLPADEIQRNPFRSQQDDAEVVVEAPQNMDDIKRIEAARQARLAHERMLDNITTQAATFSVSSIMLGSRPVAVVNGKPVTVGYTIGDVFKVERIEDRAVVIAAEGLQFRLSMDEDD